MAQDKILQPATKHAMKKLNDRLSVYIMAIASTILLVLPASTIPSVEGQGGDPRKTNSGPRSTPRPPIRKATSAGTPRTPAARANPCQTAPRIEQDVAKKSIQKESLINALKVLKKGDSQSVLINPVCQRGVDFELTPTIEKELRASGASSELIKTIRLNYRRPAPPSTLTSTPVPSPRPTTSSTAVPRVDVEGLARQGNDLVGNGNYDEAIRVASEAIAFDPKYGYGVAYLIRGTAYLAKRDYDQAIKDLTEAIQLKPQYAEAYFFRGEAYANKANLDQVSKNYANITIHALDPDTIDLAIYRKSQNKSFVLINDPHQKSALYPHEKYAVVIDFGPNTTANLNEYDQAIKDYSAAIEHGLNSSRAGVAYKRLGDIYLIKGGSDGYHQASKDFTQAIQLEPKSAAAAYIGRGIARIHSVGEGRARNASRKPLDVNDSRHIIIEVGIAKAIEDCTAAIQLDPKNQWALAAYIIRGDIHFFRYDPDEAIKDYTEAIGLEQNPNTYNALAQAYYRKGDYGQAVKQFTEAIRLDQQNASRYRDRAQAYEKLKRKDLAVADEKKWRELLSLKKE
jgi:tetratricopeptide (TPR) repeat protein